MDIYTRKGDDGTTGLLFGGRVRKDDPIPAACGDVDEAQAVLGLARAASAGDDELNEIILALQRDLWVVMAELATDAGNRRRLKPGESLVTQQMVDALEQTIDYVSEQFHPPTEFAVPGEGIKSAWLDLARTVVRRAERQALAAAAPGSLVVPYLNRLSDLVWTMARWREKEFVPARENMQ